MTRLPFPLLLIMGLAALVSFGLLYTFLDPAMGSILDTAGDTTDGEAAASGQAWIDRAWGMSPVIALGVVLLGLIVAAAARGDGL